MKITTIVPVLNEQDSIEPYLERFSKVASNLKTDYKIKVVFINNCSQDLTLDKIKKLKNQYKFEIDYITFTRNFGYQSSLLCGLQNFDTDLYFINDVDLEDPPELINDFLKKYDEGYKVIYGLRNRRDENWIMQKMRNLYYRILSKVADNIFTPFMAEFSLISKETRNELIKNESNFPFLRSEISYLGFKKIGIEYFRNKRFKGKTNYNIFGVIHFAISGFLSTSTFLLRLNFYLSIFILFFNFLLMVISLKYKLSFLNLVHINSCLIILMLGTISLYLARIYKELIKRPNYIIDRDNSSFIKN